MHLQERGCCLRQRTRAEPAPFPPALGGRRFAACAKPLREMSMATRSRAEVGRADPANYADAIARLEPEGSRYTFWDYRRKRWQRDAGMRIDHFLLNGAALGRLS